MLSKSTLCAPDLQLVSQSVLLDLHIDLGQDAFAMGGAPEGGQVRPDGINQLSMQLPIGHCQGTLQHIVGIWVLQQHQHMSTLAKRSCTPVAQ